MILVKNNLKLRDHVLPIGEHTCIMGVLNVTPDSFSDGGEYLDERKALEHAVRMAEEGADIIDIGGESSRPGAEAISPTSMDVSMCNPYISLTPSRRDSAIRGWAPPGGSSSEGWKRSRTFAARWLLNFVRSLAAPRSIATWPSWPQACMRPAFTDL